MAIENLLNGRKVALLVAKGFEQVELTEPKAALEKAGAKTDSSRSRRRRCSAWEHTDWGDEFDVDALESARAEDYDALVLPGGVMNPDFLRLDDRAVASSKLSSSRQADRRDLPRPLDLDRGQSGAGPAHDVLSVAAYRSEQCRRRLG